MHCPFLAPFRWMVPVLLLLLPWWLVGCSSHAASSAETAPMGKPTPSSAASPNESVELTGAQLRSVSIMPANERTFTVERTAVGAIDFNEDMTVQVSPPYQGRIVQLLAKAGDRVHKGEVLFTIDSPDLLQAESALVSSAGVLELTTKVLQRAKELLPIQGVAQKDYEQAVSDQQAAEGAHKAARDAVRIFGKGDAEMDRIVDQRRIESQMPVPSPLDGVVTARNAAPGTLVQPGGSPAPYTVADVSTKWMLANVPEADLPALHLGQDVDVKLPAYPDRIFHGRIDNIAEAVDPNTHRVTVRSDVRDSMNELRPQMFATFTVHLGGAARSVAVPYDAVVREGDGTMSVWVTTDQRRFVRRTVQLGVKQDGYDQILDGLKTGELIATSGALFISNASIQGAAQ
jgi:cobalt-zinc-cadmium efflux system membrane fusion protein